jgi:hypothetical protein
LIFLGYIISTNTPYQTAQQPEVKSMSIEVSGELAINVLKKIEIKGRAPKTDYTREQFGAGWSVSGGCDTRNVILNRDLTNVIVNKDCEVVSGALLDPYSGKAISFIRGGETSSAVQIDHVVALADAWQKGAQQFTKDERIALANDPLELLAVDGPTNMLKSDGDAATWLPPNKAFRCQYVARQVAVKQKYGLWVTQAEFEAIESVLGGCPNQVLPSP